MKKELIFATHNANKAAEIQSILGGSFEIKTLGDIGVVEDIPETGSTLEENAKIKSSYIYNKFNCNVFSDDTGLEVGSLNGEPGVFSARYAGPECNDSNNMNLLLSNLKGVADRTAQFKTVVSLFWEGEHHFFFGTVKGHIHTVKSGHLGFGYDPIFTPLGSDKTFAEMSAKEKNLLSHRGKALTKLSDFLLSG